MESINTKRFAVNVEYDGSNYAGWQRQAHSNSVQQEVEEALGKVAAEKITVQCAGRTDSGVHAQGQVIHFDTSAVRTERSWLLGGNTNLPVDIAFSWVKTVDDLFHARFSAFNRRYRYVIYNCKTKSAIHAGKVVNIRDELNVDLMQQGAQYLQGENDFTSFRALACQAKHPNRNITSINAFRQGKYIYLDIVANAFLHHMVRNIAGSLIDVGKNIQEPLWIKEVLDQKNRSIAGITAPPGGLYLVSVGYPEEFKLPDSPSPILYG